MALVYKYVINPGGAAENAIVREMFEDIKLYVDALPTSTGANTALSNLASVAINTSLVSDTDNTDDLGSSSVAWKDLYLKGSIKQGANTIMTFNSGGEVTQPLQPAFLATAPANTANVTGDGTTATAEYDTEVFDQGGDFNTGSYTFTAPVAGRYAFNCSIQWAGASAVSFGAIEIITSNRAYRTSIGARSTVDGIPVQIFQADMDANDTCYIQWSISGGTKTAEMTDDANYNYFSGSLIN